MKYFFSIIGSLILMLEYSEVRSQDVAFCRIKLTGGNNVVCQGQTLVLIAEEDVSFGKPVSRIWFIDGQAIEGKNLPFIRFDTSQPGTFPVAFQMSNEEGQHTTCEVVVEVLPLPEFTIETSYPFFRNFLRNRTRPRLSVLMPEKNKIQWFLDGAELRGATRPVLHVKGPGKYRVRVTSLMGCSITEEVVILE